MVSPKIRVRREQMMNSEFITTHFQAHLLYLRFRLVKKDCINLVIKKTKTGDFFLLYMMGLNIDAVIFKEVIHELARKLGYHNKDINDS